MDNSDSKLIELEEQFAYRRTGIKSPKLPKKYLKHFEHLNPENQVPKNYEQADFFNGMFQEELAKIPANLHDRVAIYVH